MDSLHSLGSGQPVDDRSSTRPEASSPEAARILDALDADDGGIRQQELVEVLDVSKATVSRRLMELEEAGAIKRLLFRGQKLVWRADDVPSALEPDDTPSRESASVQ